MAPNARDSNKKSVHIWLTEEKKETLKDNAKGEGL